MAEKFTKAEVLDLNMITLLGDEPHNLNYILEKNFSVNDENNFGVTKHIYFITNEQGIIAAFAGQENLHTLLDEYQGALGMFKMRIEHYRSNVFYQIHKFKTQLKPEEEGTRNIVRTRSNYNNEERESFHLE